MPLTDQELTTERKRAEALADLCGVHGNIDGQVAMRAILRSIVEEQTHRSRGGAAQ